MEESTTKPIEPAPAEDSDSSLNLSITPPLSENKPKSHSNSDDSISEHLSSIENDRSIQEIEISSRLSNIFQTTPEEIQNISQELKPQSLNSSFKSDISLNYLNKFCEPSSLSNKEEESLNIFANVDLDDKSLGNYKNSNDFSLNERNLNATNFDVVEVSDNRDMERKIREFEEVISMKNSTIAALTSKLDSSRETTSNPSTISTTEYKQLEDECHAKILEYNNALHYKDELIQQLSESLNESVQIRGELLGKIEHYERELAELQQNFQRKSNDSIVKTEDENSDKSDIFIPVLNLDSEYSTIEETMSLSQISLLNDLKIKINDFVMGKIAETKAYYEGEVEGLKNKVEVEKNDYEAQIKHLRDLLSNIKCGSTEIMDLKTELESKHLQEMEELRLYYEKKCSDLEKNFSEEVFSQQSRKMSADSTCSDLNSEPIFAPGPGGDSIFELPPSLTKHDIKKLKDELNVILTKITQYDLEEISNTDLKTLNNELIKCNFNLLLNCDLSSIKNELQRKYEMKVEEIIGEHEEQVKKYKEEIEGLSEQLKQIVVVKPGVSNAVQEVATSGDFEIDEVVQSYERRLQEQVTFAKIDIMNALENQIQRLVANEEDDDWPGELLQLRDRFTEKYEGIIVDLKEEHRLEVEKLKEEHLKILNGALDRARRRSLKDQESLNKGELELLKERDHSKKQSKYLRHLLSELLKYITKCEDEVNNTLVDKLLKLDLDKSQIDEDLLLDSSSGDTSSRSEKRVHLTPNFHDLINIIDTSNLDESDSNELSLDMKQELQLCLEKLRQEANDILLSTVQVKQPESGGDAEIDKVTSLTRKLISESQEKVKLKDELEDAIRLIQSLEHDKQFLEDQLSLLVQRTNDLEGDLSEARGKISELIENGHQEIISEGYGDGTKLPALDDSMRLLGDLQEEARMVLSQSRTSVDSKLLHLIEELCRVGESIKEESTKERDDLLQQISAADKKYKTTREFLEEQASEREMERDESQKRIDGLCEQLRERERDRASHDRVVTEDYAGENVGEMRQVEHLELQVQDLTKQLLQTTDKIQSLETELNEAVDKIKELREIIRELEQQAEKKSQDNDDLLLTIQKLKCIIDQQRRSLDDLKPLDLSTEFSDAHDLRRHINSLENELQQLRVNTELAGNEGVLKQIKKQLGEVEVALDKKTRDLESLHQTSTNSCSSPSEDMSVRDVTRPQTPNSMVLDECEVPLQQLARLKEKLVRHSRAEDAALKRIRDLEMQVFTLKNELEENQTEKDYIKKQIQEQLVLISDLQIRLDEQRIRADHIETQTNSCLETRIYDLQNEIIGMQEKIQAKEKTINHLNVVVKETQDRLRDFETELNQSQEDELLIQMQRDLEQVRMENLQLKEKISKEAQILPNLVENIIEDKNADIAKLQVRLDDTLRQLEQFTSLSLDRKELQVLSELKKSGSSILEGLSLMDLTEPEQVRKNVESLQEPQWHRNFNFKRNQNETTFLGAPEISSIEKESSMNFVMEKTAGKPNSTEISRIADKRVHFEDVEELKLELQAKNARLDEMEAQLKVLGELENKIGILQKTSEETELALQKATEEFEKKQKNLQLELTEKNLNLSEQSKKITVLEQDSIRKDQMCLELSRGKKELQQEKDDIREKLNGIVTQRNRDIDELNWKLTKLSNELEAKIKENLQLIQTVDSLKHEADARAQAHIKQVEANNAIEFEEAQKEFASIQKKLSEKRRVIHNLEDTVKARDATIKHLKEERKVLQETIADKAMEIEINSEDAKRYQSDITKLEQEVTILKSSLVKDGENSNKRIADLSKELHHLQDLLNEKEKIIAQMSQDYHQLHTNLETIQNKMKESGNVVDLKQKYRQELKKTAVHQTEIHSLKMQLLQLQTRKNMEESLEELTGQVQRELDYSAEIDSKIITAISDQSLGEDVEKNLRESLERQLRVLEVKYNQVKDSLDKERIALGRTQQEDAQIIEEMRLQLEAAIDKEDKFEKMLNNEKIVRRTLEQQLEGLKTRIKDFSTSSRTDSTEYKQLPTLELIQLKEQVKNLEDENLNLINQLQVLRQSKLDADNNVGYAKKLWSLEMERCKTLGEKVESLLEGQRELQGSLRENQRQLEEKVRENEGFKSLLNDARQDKEILKRQMKDFVKTSKTNDLHQQQRFVNNYNPFELQARSDYLFAMNLRLESNVKALVLQKRYLTNYLVAHQLHCRINSFVHDTPRRNMSRIRRFRSVVIVIISIKRMQFLVKRWQSGIRNFRHYYAMLREMPTAHFRIGHPVSNRQFVGNFVTSDNSEGRVTPANSVHEDLSWSGMSPPSKELKAGRAENLKAPAVLAQFVERFEQIHHQLGVAIDQNKS